MKVLAINGSPKKNGNTAYALEVVGEQLRLEGIEFEILHLGQRSVRGCLDCGGCYKNRDGKCVLPDDGVNEGVTRIADADGFLLGAPVYFSGIPGTFKSFLDRAFFVAGASGNLFRHKVAASVVADRRAGGVAVFNQLNNYLHYAETFLPNANYWNVVFGTHPGESVQDEEGTQILRVLGKNMAWLLGAVDARESLVPLPLAEVKRMTNFVRP